MKKMKKLLFLLLLVPFANCAQEVKKWEIGLNTAAVFSKYQDVQSVSSPWIFRDYYFLANHITLGAYHNFNHLQVGLRVEGGPRARFDRWLSPQVVVNYRIPLGKLDAYGGGVFGYAREQHSTHSTYSTYGENGWLTGAHAGLVYYPGKRLGINLETGVRFKRMYHEVYITDLNHPQGLTETKMMGFTETYIPISLGVRYRF